MLCGEVIVPDEPPEGPPTLRGMLGRVDEAGKGEQAASRDLVDAGEPTELLGKLLRALGSPVGLPPRGVLIGDERAAAQGSSAPATPRHQRR